MDLKQIAKEVFEATLSKVNPKDFMPEILHWDEENGELSIFDQSFTIDQNHPLYVIGTGKASPTMSQAIENVLGSHISGGLVIVPPDSDVSLERIKFLEGSHPIPDERSFSASQKLLEFIDNIPKEAVVINLISGGTSALFSVPSPGFHQENIAEVFKLLIESGASIHEVNTVRKTMSAVKGGQLLEHLRDTTLIDLIISDIPDDDLKYVGSGPTTAQEISYTDAISILKSFDIWDKLSNEIRDYLTYKKKSGANRTTKEIDKHHQWIVSSASTVAEFTKQILQDRNFKTTVSHPAWTGPIETFEEHILNKIQTLIKSDKDNQAIIFYGECTVKVNGDGLGGRNQELALRMARRLSNSERPVAFLSCGTDGIDGPTDAAGAVVNQNTYQQALSNGIDADDYIQRNDSYHFFKQAGGHLITGPTGNNVMDIQIVITN